MSPAADEGVSVTDQHASIQKAANSKNPFVGIPDYLEYKNGDLCVFLNCKTKNDLDPKILKWAFKLAEKNVGPFYKSCSLGWQPKVKLNDMKKNWARYLVAYNSEKKPVAYAMFRFDMDYGSSVLYCYEMQIEADARRKGLGRFMMSALEKCASFWKMEKVVLTVLKNNNDAKEFFTKIGYITDHSSPDASEKADYEILSKPVV